MVTETKKSKQIFPDVPREEKFAHPDGTVTTVWHHSLTQLYQALQRNFSNEGLKLPQLSQTQVDNISAIYTPLIGKVIPPGTKNYNGFKAFNYSNSTEITFIITFVNPPTQPNTNYATNPIATAGWKTVTLT